MTLWPFSKIFKQALQTLLSSINANYQEHKEKGLPKQINNHLGKQRTYKYKMWYELREAPAVLIAQKTLLKVGISLVQAE